MLAAVQHQEGFFCAHLYRQSARGEQQGKPSTFHPPPVALLSLRKGQMANGILECKIRTIRILHNLEYLSTLL